MDAEAAWAKFLTTRVLAERKNFSKLSPNEFFVLHAPD